MAALIGRTASGRVVTWEYDRCTPVAARKFARFMPADDIGKRIKLQFTKTLLTRTLPGRPGGQLTLMKPVPVVGHPHAPRAVPQDHARSAHQRTSRTVPTASNKCVTPDVATPPKMMNAQATSAAIPPSNVSDIMRSAPGWLILRIQLPILLDAGAGSHIIEPTGPVMGPNAVADVMPPGGRQESG